VAKREGAGNRGQEFWAEAVKRMNAGESVASLAQELGIKERRLYRWRAKLETSRKRSPATAGSGTIGHRSTEWRFAFCLQQNVYPRLHS
jgi:transposase-like protein